VTPYITGSYGIFTPQDTPIVGELSIFDISLGYDNPVGATFCVGTCPDQGPNEDTTITGNPVGILVDSAGYLVPHAGILDSITQLLTWDGRIQVYDAQKCLAGTCTTDESVSIKRGAAAGSGADETVFAKAAAATSRDR
jgi:hypothetical protein